MINELLKDLRKYHDTGVTMFSNLISRLENEGLTPKLLSEMKRYNGTGISVFNNLVDKIEKEISDVNLFANKVIDVISESKK